MRRHANTTGRGDDLFINILKAGDSVSHNRENAVEHQSDDRRQRADTPAKHGHHQSKYCYTGKSLNDAHQSQQRPLNPRSLCSPDSERETDRYTDDQ